MKKYLLFLFVGGCAFQGSSQNSWIQKLNADEMSPYLNTDSLTGIKDIEIAADGNIYVIATYGQSNHQELFKISSSGAPILWSVSVGYHGGLAGYFTNNIFPTSDSGCIITGNFWGQSSWFHIDGNVEKYSSTGLLEWSQTFSTTAWSREAKDVVEIGNNYYAHIGDSVVKFDHAGNILFYDSNQVMPIQQFPNSDLLVYSPALDIARIDSSGNVIWSSSTAGNCNCPLSYYYRHGINTVNKIDLRDGSTVWSKSYPWSISDLDSTSDGGFVASYGLVPQNLNTYGNSVPGNVFRCDAAGDTLWSRSFPFPHYGLPHIKVHPAGNILTGGAFILTNKDHLMYARDYSSFLTSLDSAGHGPLETTTLTWPGNANNNNVVGFADDALYVGLAFGDTGPARDTMGVDSIYFQYMAGTYSDYATDWTNSFGNGTNHKHADFDGDGVIDSSDIVPYSYGYWFPFNLPNWRFGFPDGYNSSVADLRFIAQYDTVSPGEILKYYIVLGTSNVPVDSIYGLVFSTSLNTSLISDTAQVIPYNSSMGIPGNDLFEYDFNGGFSFSPNAIFCRTDHLNAYQVADTIGELTMTIANGVTTPQDFVIMITDYNAITYHESIVQLNVLADTVVLAPTTLSVEGLLDGQMIAFPNPADKEFTMYNSQFTPDSYRNGATIIVNIYNLPGEKVKTIANFNPSESISVADLPEGFYTGQISVDRTVKNFSFVVAH